MDVWFFNLLVQVGLSYVVPLIGPISLIVLGWVVETKYTSRPSVFANAMALVEVYKTANNVPPLLALFVNFAPFVGIFFFWSYVTRTKLSENTYKYGRYYSTLIVGSLIWYALAYLK